MKILMVGGLGYLGPVVSQVMTENLKMDCIDVLDTGWFLGAAVELKKYKFDQVYIGDKRDLNVSQLEKYDVVIDLAAVSNDPMGNDFEPATIEINAEAAVELAKRAKQAGVRTFIFASSCSIYGAAGDKARQEGDFKNPLTAYALSKMQAEQGLEPLGNGNFAIKALRFATACGWSPHFRADLVLNDFVLTAKIEGKIEVLSDGTPWRPLIHVKDIGRAVAWACQAKDKGYQAYNVGSNNWTLSIGDLAQQVSEILGVPFIIVNSQGSDKRSYKVSFDKFEKAAQGWLPEQDLRSAVLEICGKLQPNLRLYKNFRQGNLIRLNILREMAAKGKLSPSLRSLESKNVS